MDALRKQAVKIRESVAKQQQAVLKTFAGGSGLHRTESIIIDEAELHRHQQLERLYLTTKAGKHFQRDIVKCVDAALFAGSKLSESHLNLSDACRRYGNEGAGVGGALAKTALHCASARTAMEKEREVLHRNLSTQVVEPLKAMVNGAPLDDARTLTQRYDRLRQEAELQVSNVFKLNQKTKEPGVHPDAAVKLQQAEQKLVELSSAMAVLGKEAASAMVAVEAQQQRLTLQRMIAMVEAERAFHQRAADILDHVYVQMVAERQRGESMPPSSSTDSGASFAPPSYDEAQRGNGNEQSGAAKKAGQYFLAEVIHPFFAENEGELSLSAGDYVVVRQVSPTGWAEGELKGRAGWFPFQYVEKRQRVPASKVVEQVS